MSADTPQALGGSKRRAVIYPTLWQPILVRGVPREYALAAMVVSAMAFMVLNILWLGFALFGLMWLVGWFLAKLDPEFFSVFLTRLQLGRTKGSEDGNVYRA